MSFAEVEDWLRGLGLICYAQAFYDNGYEDIDICKKIGEADLDVIGVKNKKDRDDILANLLRLEQGALYYEVEPDAIEELIKERVPLDPLFLKTRIKEELEKRNVQLTEPPYFNLDGSFGDLTSLAELISYDLNTITEDVHSALNQIRRRQLPAEFYAQLMCPVLLLHIEYPLQGEKNCSPALAKTKTIKNEEEDEEKTQNGLLKADAHGENALEYLNVENGMRPRRATSLSKYDSRITKSTSNLHETDLGSNQKGPVITAFKGQKKKAGAAKKGPHVFGKFLHSMRRTKSPMMGEPVRKSSSSDLNAGDIDLPQEELRGLMMKVKNKELTQDDAWNEVNRRSMARIKSKSFDGDPTAAVFDSSPESSPKEKEDPHDRKKKEKTKKKKGGKTKKHGHTSIFYSDGGLSDEALATDSQHVQLVNINSSPLPMSSSNKQQLIGSKQNGCDDSLELISFNNKSSFKSRLKRSFRRNGRSPLNEEDSDGFRSTETLNSSTGSTHSSSQDSIVSGELQENNLGQDQLLGLHSTKQIKRPPPIPVREDILHRAKPPSEQIAAAIENQHKIVRQSSKSAPVPPPRTSTSEKQGISSTSRAPGERGRSVTFNDSVAVNDISEEIARAVAERKASSSSLTLMSSTTGQTDNKNKIEFVEKTAPLPPPRPSARKSSTGRNQSEVVSAPVAPPRLKRTQNRSTINTSNIKENSDTLPETMANADRERARSLPRSSSPSSGNSYPVNESKESPPPYNRDKNQNAVSYENQRNPLSKTKSLDNTKLQTSSNIDSKPPILAEKPISKLKPMVPPRPVSTVGGFPTGGPRPPPPLRTDLGSRVPGHVLSGKSPLAVSVAHRSGDSEQSSDLAPSMHFRARPLKDLVKKKLRKESIDISRRPYTTEEGKWNVPIALLHRYSEELEKPLEDVAVAMDSIRQDILEEHGTKPIPCDVSLLSAADNQSHLNPATIDEWLISTGLPMFSEDFKEVGLTTFDSLKSFPEDEFKNIGVYDQRHLTRLLTEIKKL